MPEYSIRQTSQFKKDVKLARKQGRDMTALNETISLLQSDAPLPGNCRDHALTGDWKGFRECHISPDWLLIYMKEKNILVLTLSRVGSHAELFDK